MFEYNMNNNDEPILSDEEWRKRIKNKESKVFNDSLSLSEKEHQIKEFRNSIKEEQKELRRMKTAYIQWKRETEEREKNNV